MEINQTYHDHQGRTTFGALSLSGNFPSLRKLLVPRSQLNDWVVRQRRSYLWSSHSYSSSYSSSSLSSHEYVSVSSLVESAARVLIVFPSRLSITSLKSSWKS